MVDYSKSFLIPVTGKITENGLLLCAKNKSIRFCGELFSADTDATLGVQTTLTQNATELTLSALCTPQHDGTLREYTYFNGEWEGADEIRVRSTRLTDVVVFLRAENVSFFLSLDFPCSHIRHEKNRVGIGCDPMDPLSANTPYIPHTLTIGATVLSGEEVEGLDRAEIEAFSSYIQSRMPEHFRGERPITSTTCITNRMTDVREGRIFYSMADNPTLSLDPETLKEEVRLCAELGIEYYQLFEGYFDWEADGSSERALQEIVALGKSLGVRVGDYMTALHLHCWHYNYHDRKVEDPKMLALDEKGRRHYLCYAQDETLKMLSDTILPSIQRNGEEIICIDGDAFRPCFDPTHAHAPGSCYKHMRGITRFFEKMNATSPYFMTWTNAGNWLEFMPKLLWWNQNVYLTDPHPRDYSSALNCLKYYGDCRREQMVSVHNKYFVPYTAFTNCEYYAFKHSRVGDMAFFEYSLLQGLAVTPNLCFGELRTFLERMPAKEVPRIKGFMKKWLAFMRKHIDCWKNVYQLGDSPAVGANEAYMHANGKEGFLCLVNQNNTANRFTLTLDERVGLCREKAERFLLSEIYPEEKFLAEQPLDGAPFGTEITLSVPAHSVRFIHVEPYTPPKQNGRLYGVSGTLSMTAGGYVSLVCVENGKELDCAILLSDEDRIKDVTVQTLQTVPKYTFPTRLTDLSITENAARFTLQAPREYLSPEISEWRLDDAENAVHLSLSCSDFCGAYIHNLYKEQQKIRISVNTLHAAPTADSCAPRAAKKEPASAPFRRASTYTTTLCLPFIEWPAMSMPYGEDEVMELIFADPAAVKKIRAYMDDAEVPVCEYLYPAKPTMKTFYIELFARLKSAQSATLRLEVEWQTPAPVQSTPIRPTNNDDGLQVIQ